MQILALFLLLITAQTSAVRPLPAKDLAMLEMQSTYCKRSWPQVEFLMPLMIRADESKRNRNLEAINFFLTSYLTFFPISVANASVVFVVDEEVKDSKEFLNFKNVLNGYLQSVRLPVEPRIRIEFNTNSSYYRSGYDRQQLIKLFSDNFTASEYVGIVDSDCTFMTYVDREDLFEGGKPVVNGRIGWYGYTVPKGRNHYNPNFLWPGATLALTGHKEPIRCMSYFPIIFKTAHVREFREFVSRRVTNMQSATAISCAQHARLNLLLLLLILLLGIVVFCLFVLCSTTIDHSMKYFSSLLLSIPTSPK